MPRIHADVANRYKHAQTREQSVIATSSQPSTTIHNPTGSIHPSTATQQHLDAMARSSEQPQPTTGAKNGGLASGDGHATGSATASGYDGPSARRFSKDDLEDSREDLQIIDARKGSEDPKAIDATTRVLMAAMRNRALKDVPPLGQDGEFRAWLALLRGALVSTHVACSETTAKLPSRISRGSAAATPG
jgi:hypothetical protein